ncbi:MAG: hypothetical protein KKH01_01565 [Firmicutes bacterium]|nr:hypothetical protein [Bacillota bacterium]
MPSLLFNIAIFIGIIIIIATSLSGLRILIHRFFDFYVSRKVFLLYLIFYSILLLAVFGLIIYNFFDDGFIAVLVSVFSVLIIGLVEYKSIYKRHFDYESSGKYILCLIATYFFSFMLLIMISNLLITIFLLLFR